MAHLGEHSSVPVVLDRKERWPGLLFSAFGNTPSVPPSPELQPASPVAQSSQQAGRHEGQGGPAAASSECDPPISGARSAGARARTRSSFGTGNPEQDAQWTEGGKGGRRRAPGRWLAGREETDVSRCFCLFFAGGNTGPGAAAVAPPLFHLPASESTGQNLRHKACTL